MGNYSVFLTAASGLTITPSPEAQFDLKSMLTTWLNALTPKRLIK